MAFALVLTELSKTFLGIMQPEQYALTSFAEDHHWWFLAWRDLLNRCLSAAEIRLPDRPRILDAGCGTGGNLRFFHERFPQASLSGFDNSRLALELAQRKCPSATLELGDICAPRLDQDPLDLILCCDVIYVPGMAAALTGLKTLASHLATDGLFIIHLPAYQWLTSHHDRVMHTRERFILSQATALLKELGLVQVLASYRLSLLLPLVVAARWRSIIHAGRDLETASDLTVPPKWLNRWLLRLVQAENRFIARGHRMPFGSSIVVIGKRV